MQLNRKLSYLTPQAAALENIETAATQMPSFGALRSYATRLLRFAMHY
jgi:hypothetical protein